MIQQLDDQSFEEPGARLLHASQQLHGKTVPLPLVPGDDLFIGGQLQGDVMSIIHTRVVCLVGGGLLKTPRPRSVMQYTPRRL